MSAITTTSRVARRPVFIPSGVDVKVQDNIVFIKGPKGQLEIDFPANLAVIVKDSNVTVVPSEKKVYCRSGSGEKYKNAIPGTVRSLINNAVTGVTKGFERKLNLVGVGYRAAIKGKILNLSVGYSHPVDFPVPEGITIETPSVTEIIIKGADNDLVGHTTAGIVSVRPPEPYKGKGIIDPRKRLIRKEAKKK